MGHADVQCHAPTNWAHIRYRHYRERFGSHMTDTGCMMDGLTADDMKSVLPWNADGATLDYPILHALLEKVTVQTELALKDEDAFDADPFTTRGRSVRDKAKMGRGWSSERTNHDLDATIEQEHLAFVGGSTKVTHG